MLVYYIPIPGQNIPEKGGKKLIAILGAGLAGLLAGKALIDAGENDFVILAKEVPSPIFPGFTYLQSNCFMPLEKKTIQISKRGTARGYGLKRNSKANSWREYAEKDFVQGYSPIEAQEYLLSMLEKHIELKLITPKTLPKLKANYEHIISTIPLNILYPGAEYEFNTLWVKELPREEFIKEGLVTYSGSIYDLWSRRSFLWGRGWEEYGNPEPGAIEIIKPIRCKGIPKDSQMTLTGRLGSWQRKELAHQTYYRIFGMIRDGLIKIS